MNSSVKLTSLTSHDQRLCSLERYESGNEASVVDALSERGGVWRAEGKRGRNIEDDGDMEVAGRSVMDSRAETSAQLARSLLTALANGHSYCVTDMLSDCRWKQH